MGVGPLAIYLAQLGFQVSGEDDALTEAMQRQLVRERIVLTPPGALPATCDLVVYSSAISSSHPAAVAALARGLPLVRRGELLAEIVRGKKLVAVCGSHGKTTTTAMLITALRNAGFPAGYVLGGLFASDEVAPARIGSNDWVVAEIDESDGTIDRFSPEITLAVNLDWDHPDRYRELADLQATFAALFARTTRAVLVSDACALSARTTSQHKGPATVLTFGRTGDYRARVDEEPEGRTRLSCGTRFPFTRAVIRALGEFNASNATGALAAAHLMGMPLAENLLADYPGVRRRQAVLYEGPELTVIEDYAHRDPRLAREPETAGEEPTDGGFSTAPLQPHGPVQG
jgi:UDP-N-acetylmuramate-alanine ligase